MSETVIHLKDPRRDGRPGKVSVPASTPFPELDAATANYVRLRDEFLAAADAAAAARAALDQALLDDRAALADAHRTGARRKPSTEALDTARATLAEWERQSDALRLATGEEVEHVHRLRAERAEEWASEAETITDAKRETAAAALEAFLAAANDHEYARATVAWLRDGGMFRPGSRPVAGLAWSTVELELRRMVGLEPAEPRTLGEHVAGKGLTPAAGVPQGAA